MAKATATMGYPSNMSASLQALGDGGRGGYVWKEPWQTSKPYIAIDPAKPKRSKPKRMTDCVRADGTVSNRARCDICKKAYKKTDAVIRVQDLDNFSEDPITYHRRCMENLLAGSVDDKVKDDKRFDNYRKEVADKYGIEVDDE